MYEESKKTELTETENRLVVARGGSGGGDEKDGQKVQTCSYKRNNS